MMRMLQYTYLKLAHGFLWSKLLAESAETRWTYVISHANDMYGGGSETGMSRRFWI